MAFIPSPETNNYPDPFVEAAMQDDTLVALLQACGDVGNRVYILEEVAKQRLGSVPSGLQGVREELRVAEQAARDREEYLRDIWAEMRGDEGGFLRLVNVRDLQSMAETAEDPTERRRLLDEFNEAREDLEAYLYDPDYQEPQ